MTDQLAQSIKKSKAPAITRAVAILKLLGKSNEPIGLQAIVHELGLVPSTCLYVLRALEAEEMVSFDTATKRYRLSAGVLTLARQFLRNCPFHEVVQDPLDDLAAAFDVTTLGVQIVGLDHIIALAISQGEGNFRLSTQVGSRFPALISATGRCIAAFGDRSPTELKDRFDQLRWDNPPSFDLWCEQVQMTRQNGYSIDAGHYISGVTVAAAPVYSGAAVPSHAVVALGLEGVINARGLDRLGDALREAAASVSLKLGDGLQS
mgnify:CR=1 FL=1